MRNIARVTSWAAALGVCALACDRVPNGDGKAEQELERERVQVAHEATSTGRALAFNDAINAIVDARCGHELRCDNVGGGKRYESDAVCKESVRTGFSDDVVPTECPDAVDRRALSACVKAVRDEGCGAPLDTLARLPQCRTPVLCPRTS